MVMAGAGNAAPQPFRRPDESLGGAVLRRWAQRISFCGSAAYSTLLSDAVYFLVTRWILVHKLNLE